MKKIIALFLSTVLMLTALMTPTTFFAQAAEGQEAYMQSFEDYAANTSLKGNYIVSDYTDNWLSYNVTTAEAHSGTKSLKTFSRYHAFMLPLEAAQLKAKQAYKLTYYWKMRAFTQSGTANALSYTKIVSKKSSQKLAEASVISSLTTAVTATGDWQKVEIVFKPFTVTPEAQLGLMVYPISAASSGDNGMMWIDDITVEETEEIKNDTPLIFENEAPTTDKTVKVLAIGNSFSDDATFYLRPMAQADGVDLRVASLMIGGCSLERHYNNTFNGTTDYSMVYFTPKERFSRSRVSLCQALNSEDWDYVTVQQASAYSVDFESYEPFATGLMECIREYCPDAEILIHETWAYPEASCSAYGSQQEMFNRLKNAYLQFSKLHHNARIIPSGEGIQLARATTLGDTLSRDSLHCNRKGSLIAGWIWYETFTGIAPQESKFNAKSIYLRVPNFKEDDLTDDEVAILQNSAHEAFTMYRDARPCIEAIDALGEITLDSHAAIEACKTMYAALAHPELVTNADDLAAAEAKYISLLTPGDINGDGRVTLADVVAITRYSLGDPKTAVIEQALDVNNDGTAGNLKDAAYLAQYIAGWENREPHLSRQPKPVEPDPDAPQDVEIDVSEIDASK